MLVEDANDVENEHTVEDGLAEVMEVLRHALVAPAVLEDREVALEDGVECLVGEEHACRVVPKELGFDGKPGAQTVASCLETASVRS